MASLKEGWAIQVRVVSALMIRELTTRFGRENIGFLWIMAEPLLFASLVGVVWTFMKGPEEHGISVVSFVASGYIPLTMFRNSVSRSVGVFAANSSLMYHRQIKVLDFIFVRVLIEMIGASMAYLFIAVILMYLDLFPVPADIGYLLAGWLIYGLFTFSVCLILAPLSEQSEVLEKFMPVTTYIMIPFSGTFNMTSWLTPDAQAFMAYSPPVNAMEMMRYGIYGHDVHPIYEPIYPITVSLICMLVGLVLCRQIRRKLVVE